MGTRQHRLGPAAGLRDSMWTAYILRGLKRTERDLDYPQKTRYIGPVVMSKLSQSGSDQG